MHNILINKTDPYSFMGLVTGQSTRRAHASPLLGVINAGFISILVIFAIIRMAHASGAAEQGVDGLRDNNALTPSCSREYCHMV